MSENLLWLYVSLVSKCGQIISEAISVLTSHFVEVLPLLVTLKLFKSIKKLHTIEEGKLLLRGYQSLFFFQGYSTV